MQNIDESRHGEGQEEQAVPIQEGAVFEQGRHYPASLSCGMGYGAQMSTRDEKCARVVTASDSSMTCHSLPPHVSGFIQERLTDTRPCHCRGWHHRHIVFLILVHHWEVFLSLPVECPRVEMRNAVFLRGARKPTPKCACDSMVTIMPRKKELTQSADSLHAAPWPSQRPCLTGADGKGGYKFVLSASQGVQETRRKANHRQGRDRELPCLVGFTARHWRALAFKGVSYIFLHVLLVCQLPPKISLIISTVLSCGGINPALSSSFYIAESGGHSAQVMAACRIPTRGRCHISWTGTALSSACTGNKRFATSQTDAAKWRQIYSQKPPPHAGKKALPPQELARLDARNGILVAQESDEGIKTFRAFAGGKEDYVLRFGDHVCVIGKNGAGKSLFCQALGGHREVLPHGMMSMEDTEESFQGADAKQERLEGTGCKEAEKEGAGKATGREGVMFMSFSMHGHFLARYKDRVVADVLGGSSDPLARRLIVQLGLYPLW